MLSILALKLCDAGLMDHPVHKAQKCGICEYMMHFYHYICCALVRGVVCGETFEISGG